MTTISLRLPILGRCTSCLTGEARLMKIVVGCLIGLVLLFLGFYLFQLGDLTRSSYLMKASQMEISKISGQNLSLQEKSSGLLSLESVEERIEQSNFVKVSEIKYLSIPSYSLAQKTQ